jgi:hypothetical protein
LIGQRRTNFTFATWAGAIAGYHMIGVSTDLTADAVVMVDTEFTFKTRKLKQRHSVVVVAGDGA